MQQTDHSQRSTATSLQIVICGVGGQGVLYFAKNLYCLAVMAGTRVLGSETHGMSQRGGSVLSHVKIGEFSSPMVQRGTADILFALKAEEAYSNLTFLRDGGHLVINAPANFELSGEIAQILAKKKMSILRFDASRRAMELGQPAGANLVLLAHSCAMGILPYSVAELEAAVKTVTPEDRVPKSLKAVRAGLS